MIDKVQHQNEQQQMGKVKRMNLCTSLSLLRSCFAFFRLKNPLPSQHPDERRKLISSHPDQYLFPNRPASESKQRSNKFFF